ncbi:MAG: hypothetical protein UV19_C0017G0010 [Parcubacteria group bacterium GW2011_GWA2_42_28]|nr:MAG: hypothetical protein UV19_C0017G0010 [Parcubacteria group bacterium GW2011_GWA2_42_28]
MKIETPPSGQSQTKKELPSFVGDPPTERGFHVTRFEKMAKEILNEEKTPNSRLGRRISE